MKNDVNISSNKSFGIVFFIFFFIISLYPLVHDHQIRIWSLIISLIFLFLGLKNSRILTPINHLWFKLGILLGRIFSPVVMGFIFFVVVTPIGLIMRIFNKDLLSLKFHKKRSYWNEKKGPNSEMKNQF